MHCNLMAAQCCEVVLGFIKSHNAPVNKFKLSNLRWIQRPIYSLMWIFWQLVGIYQSFVPFYLGRPCTCVAGLSVLHLSYFDCACTETAISKLLVKIPTPSLDSVTEMSYKGAIIWRPNEVFRCSLLSRSETCHISISGPFDLMILNKCHKLCAILG